ncbi:putative F-box domain-containing protein [Tanacetum coccineum]
MEVVGDDMVEQILLRSDVRDLIPCKAVCSSNGLVCLITPDAKHIYVINPSIRHIKQLPGDLPITILKSPVYVPVLVTILSMMITCSNVGVLYNGSLHWFTEDDNKEVSIVSFDVSREEFKEIPQPDDPRYEWQPYRRLGIMNGCLSIYNYGFGHDDDIWIMNNYNVKHSWEMYLHYHNRECQVIHSLYESNIPSEGAQKIFGQVIWDLMTHKYVCASVFVESLVSPHVQGKQ